jgi:nitrate/TMAO reductase-like tetraheme cytochrome c subunit
MALLEDLKKGWIRPAFYFGNNHITLVGSALTTASAFTLFTFWTMNAISNRYSNPYQGIIFFFALPVLFVLGLILIPVGILLRRRELQQAARIPPVYPPLDLNDPAFRRGVAIVIFATVLNVLIVGTASYEGVTYMDSATFCGTSCHVMKPQWAAYQDSPHSHVDCVECHVGAGMSAYLAAKVNGTKQLFDVAFNSYPRPITTPLSDLRPARATCERCHTPAKFVGDRLLVFTSFGDDQANTASQTVLLMHIGGIDSLDHLHGIHGAHLGHYYYVATDTTDQKIVEVDKPNPNGTLTKFIDTTWKGPVNGVRREMDCMDCHNQATHVFQTPEDALDEVMVDGTPASDLPYVHKEGLRLIKASYASQSQAQSKITSGLEAYYRTQYPEVWTSKRGQVEQAARALVAVYSRNVFPSMKVIWGTYPNNIGHMVDPGCFRCHDGNHVAKNGETISNDCSLCHDILAYGETHPKILGSIGITNTAMAPR